MAGMGLPSNNLACPWVGDMGCVCPLPTRQGCICVVSLHQPFQNTQRRFCMAGYHCLMPNGISFVATQHKSNTHGISSDETQHKSNGLTAFIPLQKHQQSNAYSISSSKTWLQSVCLSAFLPKNKNPQHLVWNRHCGKEDLMLLSFSRH